MGAELKMPENIHLSKSRCIQQSSPRQCKPLDIFGIRSFAISLGEKPEVKWGNGRSWCDRLPRGKLALMVLFLLSNCVQ